MQACLCAGSYPFDVDADALPEPEEGWEDDYDSSDSDDMESCLKQWRADKREELIEDMICDVEPLWTHPAFDADPVALDLVRAMLEKEPRARLSAAEALEHCWFTGHCCHDAASLKHVHVRISALASASAMPVRRSSN
jgi:serine/threonine protein kinase